MVETALYIMLITLHMSFLVIGNGVQKVTLYGEQNPVVNVYVSLSAENKSCWWAMYSSWNP